MTRRDREYDRFGPWVLEISDEDPLPPRFVPYMTRSVEPLISIKIPRHIERRNARPGMDLYDFVVSLYDGDLVILGRDGEDVRDHTFRYEQIAYLRVSEELLRGVLRLATPSKAFDLPYNTVSSELMGRFVGTVRERYLDAASDTPPTTDLGLGEDTLGFYFERLLRAERAGPGDMSAVAAQPATAISRVETNTLRRMLYGVVSKRLTETLWLCDGRELKIIDRGSTYTYRWQTSYGLGITYLPLAKLRRAEWSDPADAKLLRLRLATDAGKLDFVFTTDNETVPELREYLERAAARH